MILLIIDYYGGEQKWTYVDVSRKYSRSVGCACYDPLNDVYIIPDDIYISFNIRKYSASTGELVSTTSKYNIEAISMCYDNNGDYYVIGKYERSFIKYSGVDDSIIWKTKAAEHDSVGKLRHDSINY